MPEAPQGYIKVGEMSQVRIRKCVPIQEGSKSIAVFYHDGQLSAVTNRCPHAGYNFELGKIDKGVLTCIWHQARFNLADGTCLDAFTDDIDTFDVAVVNGEVWVDPNPRPR